MPTFRGWDLVERESLASDEEENQETTVLWKPREQCFSIRMEWLIIRAMQNKTTVSHPLYWMATGKSVKIIDAFIF